MRAETGLAFTFTANGSHWQFNAVLHNTRARDTYHHQDRAVRPPFFQRDEHFRVLEPAHCLAFGYRELNCRGNGCQSHLRTCVERPNLPRWNFYSGTLVPTCFFYSDYHNQLNLHREKAAVPKVLYGLMAAGTDVCVRSEDAWPELSTCHCKRVLPTR